MTKPPLAVNDIWVGIDIYFNIVEMWKLYQPVKQIMVLIRKININTTSKKLVCITLIMLIGLKYIWFWQF